MSQSRSVTAPQTLTVRNLRFHYGFHTLGFLESWGLVAHTADVTPLHVCVSPTRLSASGLSEGFVGCPSHYQERQMF